MPARKSPLDQALDLLLFAPVGLALTAKDELPKLIEKGRERVSNQVAVAKMVGQFAVTTGQREAEKAASRLAEQAATVAGRVSGLPGMPGPTSGAAHAPVGAEPAGAAGGWPAGNGGLSPRVGTAPGTPIGGGGAAGAGSPNGGATTSLGTVSPPPGTHVAPGGPTSAATAPPPAELAIPGYDTLSASQVVQRLGGLSGPELEAVRRYEESNRSRRTILSKVAQLQQDGS